MICIYHSKDLDGYCSGAIVKKKYPEAKLIGYDYGQPIPWDEITPGEPVIMVDVSLPMPDMYTMAMRSDFQMTWIDHHISAINDYSKYVEDLWKTQSGTHRQDFLKPILQVGIAACEITWSYLFAGERIPLAVSLLGQYDTWRNNDKTKWECEILPFQYGMRHICNSVEAFPQNILVNGTLVWDEIDKITENGETIIAYQRQLNEVFCRNSFKANFKGLRAICLNTNLFNSTTFDSVWDESKYDVMIPFQFNGKDWKFSLYTTKDEVNCSELAKSMGGGGHAKAAGFSAKNLEDVLTIKM